MSSLVGSAGGAGPQTRRIAPVQVVGLLDDGGSAAGLPRHAHRAQAVARQTGLVVARGAARVIRGGAGSTHLIGSIYILASCANACSSKATHSARAVAVVARALLGARRLIVRTCTMLTTRMTCRHRQWI